MRRTRLLGLLLAFALATAASGDDAQVLVRDRTAFATSLSAELAAREGNLFPSPQNLFTNLAMVLLLIPDDPTGSIFFTGRLVKPAAP